MTTLFELEAFAEIASSLLAAGAPIDLVAAAGDFVVDGDLAGLPSVPAAPTMKRQRKA